MWKDCLARTKFIECTKISQSCRLSCRVFGQKFSHIIATLAVRFFGKRYWKLERWRIKVRGCNWLASRCTSRLVCQVNFSLIKLAEELIARQFLILRAQNVRANCALIFPRGNCELSASSEISVFSCPRARVICVMNRDRKKYVILAAAGSLLASSRRLGKRENTSGGGKNEREGRQAKAKGETTRNSFHLSPVSFSLASLPFSISLCFPYRYLHNSAHRGAFPDDPFPD